MRKTFLLVIVALLSFSTLQAESDNVENGKSKAELLIKQRSDKNPKKKQKRVPETDSLGNPIKTGWNFGILPGVSYSSDVGALFGAITTFFNYGDGKIYPNYYDRLYVKDSYTTMRMGTVRMYYDSDYAIKDHKLAVDLSYVADALYDFYGFNGSQSIYNYNWINNESSDYVSKVFYRQQSNLFRSSVDICGKISGHWNWMGGIGVLNFKESRVKNGLLKNVPDGDSVPELWKLYNDWGIIKPEECTGGWHPFVHAGIRFDSRPYRVNAPKGVYADLFLTYYSAFGKESGYNNVKLNFNFQHYVTIVPQHLIFAYHIAGQNTIIGTSPYYLDSYLNTIYLEHDKYYGLGGGTTLRGVLRNRIWVPGFAYANIELRGIFWNFKIGRQYFYIGANAFIDAGMVTQKKNFDVDGIKEAFKQKQADPTSWIAKTGKTLNDFFDFDANGYKPHFSGGIGLKGAMNHNFVVSAEWGIPFDKQDNHTVANSYLEVGYLF